MQLKLILLDVGVPPQAEYREEEVAMFEHRYVEGAKVMLWEVGHQVVWQEVVVYQAGVQVVENKEGLMMIQKREPFLLNRCSQNSISSNPTI